MLKVRYVLLAGILCGLVGVSWSQMGEGEAERLESARGGSALDEQEELERANRAAAVEAELSAVSPDTGALAEGRKLYEAGDYTLAIERFLVAQRTNPDDPRAPLFLGLTHLRLDDPGKAVVSWNEYVKKAGDDPLAEDVSKYMTILLHEANERNAQAALAREGLLSEAMTDPGTVAVGPFRNLGSPEYAPLGKSLAAMLIDNLQAIPDLRVLEREQVQALVAEAGLAEKGLVEASTAVRAGKLLRAGTVTGGSHIDFTRSPTRLKVEAVLVDVDNGQALATSTKENDAEQFYEIVPAIAAEFTPVLTKQTVAELPPEQQERLTEEHTKSLPAAIAFGKALEAKDDKDAAEAQRWCDEAQSEDPDFRLARRVCGLIPPVWMSPQAVAAAVEAQVMVAAAGVAGAGWTPWVVGGLVVGGAAAGGAIAASGGGDGDGDGGQQVTEGGGNNAPGLQGVPGSATVNAGNTLTYNISSGDPDGNQVTLTATNLPANSTFSQSSGIFTAVFRFTPTDSQANQTFSPQFCATDNGNPPAQRCQTSNIQVRRAEPTATPPLMATATPPPMATPTEAPMCSTEGEVCDPQAPESECCPEFDCAPSQQSPEQPECCVQLGEACSDAGTCCFQPAVDGEVTCDVNCCIVAGGFGCSGTDDSECCGASICSDGFCCIQDGGPCTSSSECCGFGCYDGTCGFGGPA